VQVLEGLIAGGGGGLSKQALSGVNGVRVIVSPLVGLMGSGSGFLSTQTLSGFNGVRVNVRWMIRWVEAEEVTKAN
jgi:hypothetical protein